MHPFAPNEGKNAPELIKFRNDEKTPPFGTDVWHSDETFRAEPPMATMLVAKEVPAVGGDSPAHLTRKSGAPDWSRRN